MGVIYDDLVHFRNQLEEVNAKRDEFLEACVKELAARLLRKVIRRTPVRDPENCPAGVVGGTLRRGWTSKTHEEAVSRSGQGGFNNEFLNSLQIRHTGDRVTIEVKNPVEYAFYVEYGHRTRGGNGWVSGKYMLTMSEQELKRSSRQIIERKLRNWLGGAFGG